MSNILKEANHIINERSEEKERQYGPFSEGMKRAAMIASGMSGRTWTANDMYIAMIALKFSRQSYNFKEDNLLDAAAYIGAWQNFIDDSKPTFGGPDVTSESPGLLKDSHNCIMLKGLVNGSGDCESPKNMVPQALLKELIREVK
tara:strand:- start:8422 stop:8856 length:435 start_codon:yes stop_codon:yes gene_type:complete